MRGLKVCVAIGTALGLSLPAPGEGASRLRYGGQSSLAVSGLGPFDRPFTHGEGFDARVAGLVHCRLLRWDGEALRPELAAQDDVGAVGLAADGRPQLTYRLVEQSRFHGGEPILPRDVVASWQAMREDPEALFGPIAERVEVAIAGPRTVRFTLPRGTDLEVFRRVLSHPLVPVLRAGRPGAGAACGAFATAARTQGEARLVAWPYHPLGRPYLDGLTLVLAEGDREAQALRHHGEVELGPPAGRGLAQRESFLALVRRGPEVLTRLRGLAQTARLWRFTPVAAEAPRGLLPSPWRMRAEEVTVPTDDPRGVSRAEVAYLPEEDTADLARALRDGLDVDGRGRIVPTGPGALMHRGGPPVIVLRHRFGAVDGWQALWELHRRVGSTAMAPEVFLRGPGGPRPPAPAGLVPLGHVEGGFAPAPGLVGVGGDLQGAARKQVVR